MTTTMMMRMARQMCLRHLVRRVPIRLLLVAMVLLAGVVLLAVVTNLRAVTNRLLRLLLLLKVMPSLAPDPEPGR